MSDEINYNHRHKRSSYGISGTHAESITVKDMRDAIADLPDEAEIIFSSLGDGSKLMFYRFKTRGENLLQMEFNTDD